MLLFSSAVALRPGAHVAAPTTRLRHAPLMTATLEDTEEATTSRLFGDAERSLERLTSNQQALLEAVVGLTTDEATATYDRDATVAYFARRPTEMARRAYDFLQAFRRVKAVWEQGTDGQASGGRDRGAVLRSELSKLGPVSVKIGQTLSQRPDILPEDVCEALKGLQTSNEPFADALAFQVMAEEFNVTGPLAPGIVAPGCDPNGEPFFAALSSTCIASASLGQVYRGTTHEGLEIAVKVQRPDALKQCLLDGSVIIAALKAIEGRYWNGDLLAIFDLVAGGVVQELDFRHEAANCKEFGESLRFLGYVDVPVTLPQLTTRRAMAMEWVRRLVEDAVYPARGRHPLCLPGPSEGLGRDARQSAARAAWRLAVAPPPGPAHPKVEGSPLANPRCTAGTSPICRPRKRCA